MYGALEPGAKTPKLSSQIQSIYGLAFGVANQSKSATWTESLILLLAADGKSALKESDVMSMMNQNDQSVVIRRLVIIYVSVAYFFLCTN